LPPKENGEIAQITEDAIGSYTYHDFFLYHMLRNHFSPDKIYQLALLAFGEAHKADIKSTLKTFYHRFFTQQFKRNCMPDGVKVGSVCLSPRGDWRMPSDASADLWLKEVDQL
jgi:NAD+ synthase (glutamine-hydrolysing)